MKTPYSDRPTLRVTPTRNYPPVPRIPREESGRLERASQMRESVLKRNRRSERCGEFAQMFGERHAKPFKFLIESPQRSKLVQDMTKPVLENVHRLEHPGQIAHPHLELTQLLKHICQLSEPLHRFAKRRDTSQLRLQRLDLVKNCRYRQSAPKTLESSRPFEGGPYRSALISNRIIALFLTPQSQTDERYNAQKTMAEQALTWATADAAN